MTTLTVAIVNWNTRDRLRECLAALDGATRHLRTETVVVDNASGDGSAAMVQREFPGVRLIESTQNLGFAGGVNAVLEDAEGDFVLVLNPDVQVDRDALGTLLAFLRDRPDVAAVAPLLVGEDGRPHSHLFRRPPSLPQLALFWTVLAPLCRRIGPLRRRWFEHDLRGETPVRVAQVPGAAMLIRRDALVRVGDFDAGYFIWFEDVDWCRRAREAGLALFAVPSARMRHAGGASFVHWTARTRVLQFYRAFFRFACKHRLDRLLRWGWPILSVDLALKRLLLAAGRALRVPVARRVGSLALVQSAVREVLASHRQGCLVEFSSAPEVDGSPAPSPSSARLVPQCVDGVAVVSGTDPIDERRPAHAPADVVIVNWNGRDFLPRCLEALARSTVPVRVIVVDNASQDGSVDYIRSEHPEVDVVALDENVGYAAGANVGLRHGGAPYAIVMNPDVALAPGYLERLIERCEADPRIGAAQGKLYATAPAEFIGGRLEPGGTLDSAGHSIRRSRMVVDRGQGRPDGPAYNRECSVFSACGAALLLRRSMLEDVAVDGEYFDPSFFAYKEDIDLCWRARLRGWDIRYVPTAVGHHVRSWAGPGTSPTSRPPLAARRHSWKNHYLLVIKNDRPADWLRALPWIAAWELLRQGHALLRDPKVWGAYGDLLRMIPAAWSRRRRIQGRRSVRPAAIRTWFGSTAPTVVSCETGAPIASGHLEKG